jgi:hypothetical protein
MNGGTWTDEAALTRELAGWRAKNDALGDALAGLLGHLRGRPYGSFFGSPEEALCDEADRFVGRLAKHLWYAEGLLFPALRDARPESSREIQDLQEDHRIFRLYARDLALHILGRDNAGACGVARAFLAFLLNHIRQETGRVDGLIRSMGASDTRRLSDGLRDEGRQGGRPGPARD